MFKCSPNELVADPLWRRFHLHICHLTICTICSISTSCTTCSWYEFKMSWWIFSQTYVGHGCSHCRGAFQDTNREARVVVGLNLWVYWASFTEWLATIVSFVGPRCWLLATWQPRIRWGPPGTRWHLFLSSNLVHHHHLADVYSYFFGDTMWRLNDPIIRDTCLLCWEERS